MIAVYCRVSTDKQLDNYSIPDQKRRGMAFAESLGEQAKVYAEAASGGTTQRSELEQLRGDIERGEIDKVWTVALDRLTRTSPAAMEELFTFLAAHDVKLYIDGHYQPLDDPDSLLSPYIQGIVAYVERHKIRKRTKRGKENQINSGNQRYSSLYGYNFKMNSQTGKREWYVDEDEAKLVRYIYQLYFEDLGFDQICRRLMLEGYKTKRNRSWDRGTLHLILRRPEYIGLTHNIKGELIPSKVYAPIMDRETWEAVQRTIDGKIRARQGKHFKPASYELSGLIRCAECDARYFYHQARREGTKFVRQQYFHKLLLPEQMNCNQSPKVLSKYILEYLVRALFYDVFSDYDEIKRCMSALQVKLNRKTETITQDIARVRANIVELELQRDRLVKGVQDGIFTSEEIRPNVGELRQQLVEQQSNIEKLEEQLVIAGRDTQDILDAFSDDVISRFEESDARGRREIYLRYIKTLTVKDYKITVTFITETTKVIDLKTIPDLVLDQMVRIRYTDLHAEDRIDHKEDLRQNRTFKAIVGDLRADDALVDSESIVSPLSQEQDSRLRDALEKATERMTTTLEQLGHRLKTDTVLQAQLTDDLASIRASFILRTKGRPRRMRKPVYQSNFPANTSSL